MILLYKGIGASSRVIQWQNRSEYSHAAWLTQEGTVIEAWADSFLPVPRGSVREQPTIDHGHTPGTVVEVFDFVGGAPDELRAGVTSFMRGQVGKAYDFWGIMGFVSRRPRRDNGKWFCSELLFAACLKNDLRLLSRIESWAVFPGLIALSPIITKIDEVKIVFATPISDERSYVCIE